MKTTIQGAPGKISKWIVNFMATDKPFLEDAKKEKSERVPFMIRHKYKVQTGSYQDHLFHTINGESDKPLHILYFHGGALSLNGSIAHWMMIDKWVKKTNAKATYFMYPLLPQYKTTEIYERSAEMTKIVMDAYPNDQFVLAGDSAGGIVILHILQSLKEKAFKHVFLLSPWIDFALKNPEIPSYEANDPMLAMHRFVGYEELDDVSEHGIFENPMDYTYQVKMSIYQGTYDLLCPDVMLFEQKHPDVDLRIYEACPHVFMLFPMKQADDVNQDIISKLMK